MATDELPIAPSGDNPSPAPALAYATWCGSPDVLPTGSPVEVLAVDAAGRISRVDGAQGVPARTACWIRWWPEAREHARFRSCDLADLDLGDEDWGRLFAMTQGPDFSGILHTVDGHRSFRFIGPLTITDGHFDGNDVVVTSRREVLP